MGRPFLFTDRVWDCQGGWECHTGVMLSNSQKLLDAAAEAQACGRVGASIAYLKMIHADLTEMIAYVDRSDERKSPPPPPRIQPFSPAAAAEVAAAAAAAPTTTADPSRPRPTPPRLSPPQACSWIRSLPSRRG